MRTAAGRKLPQHPTPGLPLHPPTRPGHPPGPANGTGTGTRPRTGRPSLATLALAGTLAAFATSPAPAPAQFEEQFGVLAEIATDITVKNGSLSFDSQTGVVKWERTGSAPITATYENVQIFADSLRYDYRREMLTARGDVSVYKDGIIYRGENIIYDLRSEEISASALRTALEPIYVDAGDFQTATSDISVLKSNETIFTTHDSIDSSFRIRAKTVEIYPEDRVVFRSLKAYAGKVPVFYFPYVSQPLDGELGYTFAPGYSDSWGAYLLNQYGTLWGDHSLVKYHLDFRSERGIAGGMNILSRRYRDNPNLGEFQFYIASDKSPETTTIGRSTTRPEGLVPDENRYRVNLQHRIYLPGPEESTFYVDFDLNKVSDEFFYEDFFPSEFRVDPRPDNIINAVKTHDRGTLSVLGRFQVNDFFQTDERLPEIALDLARQPLFGTGLFYEGTASIGIYSEDISSVEAGSSQDRVEELRDNLRRSQLEEDFLAFNPGFDEMAATQELDELQARLDGRSFTRFHTYHELLYPTQAFGWLNVVPRVGAGVATYSDVEGGRGANPDGDARDGTRGLFHAGVEASFKSSRTFPDVVSPGLGIDGLRHVVQPYTNLSYLSVGGDDIGAAIDRLVPSTRLRPIDVPQFTAIDDLTSWNVFRAGVRNRLLTRRDGGNYNWAGLDTYVDFFIDDPEFDRDYSNLFNDLYWRPLPWLRLNLDSQVPVGGGGDLEFTEVNTRVTFQPTRWWEFTLGHQLLQDHPFFEDSSLITFRTYARLTDNWGFGMTHRYELDDSTLEIQQYSIHRDLSSWTASVGAMLRDNRGDDEFGVIFALTLKAFPQVSLPFQFNPGGTQ